MNGKNWKEVMVEGELIRIVTLSNKKERTITKSV